MLAAVRCGEMQPIMLARTIATLDHMLQGRLTINIITSDFPGEVADSNYRYQRSREVVEILRQAWTRDRINYDGEVYQFKDVWTDPAKPYQQNGGPLMYFGGYSPDALELCGAALRRLPDVARAQGADRRADEGGARPRRGATAARWTTACGST